MIDSSSHLPLSRKSFHFLDQADSMDAYFFSISARLSISCRRWSHSLYPLSQRLTVRMYLPTSQKLSLLDCSMSSLTDMLMVYSQPLACWCTKDFLGPSQGKWLKVMIHSQFTSNLWTEIVHRNWKSVYTLSSPQTCGQKLCKATENLWDTMPETEKWFASKVTGQMYTGGWQGGFCCCCFILCVCVHACVGGCNQHVQNCDDQRPLLITV